MKKIGFSLVSLLLGACAVGPNYVRPDVCTPKKFKEAPKGMKIAQPGDHFDRGKWWVVFHENKLSELESELNRNNQNIAVAIARYNQSLAIVNETRSQFFPVVTASVNPDRERFRTSTTNTNNIISTNNGNNATTVSSTSSPVSATYSALINATWEPDLWGAVRRAVEASVDTAQANAAQLASTRLSMQATLAQFYFQLRALDQDQVVLDETVRAYQKALKIATNRYNAGVASRADVISAESVLDAAQASASNNGVNRAIFEHAIAVLVGQPASCFAIAKNPLNLTPPKIPLQVPCTLLERRPDIANAERLMAAANAQIGQAIAAFFPVVTLSGDRGYVGTSHWFSPQDLVWSLSAQAVQTLFDGGLRIATTQAARSNYEATVATYRQTVLAAFQDVEDNLSTLRILAKQYTVQQRAVDSAKHALKLVTNQYKSGTADFAAVIVAQTILFNAEKNAADLAGQRMVATVGLIKALGGGWDTKQICPSRNLKTI